MTNSGEPLSDTVPEMLEGLFSQSKPVALAMLKDSGKRYSAAASSEEPDVFAHNTYT